MYNQRHGITLHTINQIRVYTVAEHNNGLVDKGILKGFFNYSHIDPFHFFFY